MDYEKFDRLTSYLAGASTRRRALQFLAATPLGVGSLAVLHQHETEAKHKHKKHKKHQHNPTLPPAPKGLQQSCTPGVDTCTSGLQCSTPTTRQTCSSTVLGVSDWCCVPPGGSCTECDCCGDYYCEFDDNNHPHCVPNPER